MPAAWVGAAAALYGATKSTGGSTGGSGANMYVPTGLGYADTGWQQNQQANQNQLNYMGGGYPQFMGGATSWGSDGMLSYGGGQSYGSPYGGSYPGAYSGTTPPGNLGGYGMNGFNGFTNGSSSGSSGGGAGGGGRMYPMDQNINTSTGADGVTSYGSDPTNAAAGGSAGQSSGGGATQTSQTPYQGSGAGGGLAGLVDPALYQSYALQQGINYNPYLQASQQAGQQYAGLNQLAGQTGQGMLNEGQYAFGQQGQLGQAGSQFNNQQQGLAGQSAMLGYGQLGQSQQLAQGLQGAGQQVYNTAFDPQQELYKAQFQQATDQANAVNSMYGLGQSAAGAGMVNEAQQNFNTNWENQQLARQSQGLQAMTGANQAASGILGTGYGGAQQGLGQAGTLGQQGIQGLSQTNQVGGALGTLGNASLQGGYGQYNLMPNNTLASAQTPLNAQQTVAGMPSQNAQQYITGLSSAMTPYAQQQNQAIPYMNYGSGAGANAFQNTLAQNKFNSSQQQQLGNALGQVNWGQLGSVFNSGYGQPQSLSSSDAAALYGSSGYGDYYGGNP